MIVHVTYNLEVRGWESAKLDTLKTNDAVIQPSNYMNCGTCVTGKHLWIMTHLQLLCHNTRKTALLNHNRRKIQSINQSINQHLGFGDAGFDINTR